MVEVTAEQYFGTVSRGITLASELAKMIPKATGYVLQSPCLMDQTT
jgi:hypothetical protein